MLVGNKPKEVFSYIYNHSQVIDNLVKHVSQKSISEVLIRILNVSDNVLEEGIEDSIETLRQSFIHKIVNRLDP